MTINDVDTVWEKALNSTMDFRSLQKEYAQTLSKWPREKTVELLDIAICSVRSMNNCDPPEVLYKSFGSIFVPLWPDSNYTNQSVYK